MSAVLEPAARTSSDLLAEGVRRNASDILISAGAPVTYHVYGVLQKDDTGPPLTAEETAALVDQMLTPELRSEFKRTRDLDFGVHIPGVARFRVNAFLQKGTVAAVLRIIPLEVPHHSALGIPDRLILRMASTPDGLVLVTGPTGAGKSSTVASFLRYLNTEAPAPRHIVTIEDPIEYLFNSGVCVIEQREIGSDTRNYTRGLKSALRQMPHVIFVGEMRDRETIRIALTAAETGNLVISTLSTQSAAKTVNRIIDVFPVKDQPEVRARLALALRIVVSQVLLRRVDRPGRVAAREILYMNSAIANLVREGKIHQLNNMIASGASEGMCLLDDSLLDLVRQGVISAADAGVRFQDSERMRALVKR